MSDIFSYSLDVTEAEGGERLDRFLVARQLPFSRSQLKKAIDAAHCEVNGEAARPSTRLKPGDRVSFLPPPPVACDVLPEQIPLSVLFEDDDLIVLDKPAGMVVHPAPGHQTGTLVSALLAHCDGLSGVGGELRPGIVHRLDKDTSGVMVATKTDMAHLGLGAQFEKHSIERRYLALVAGDVSGTEGTFDTLHGRHPTDRKRYTSRVSRGRRAVTHFTVLERFGHATLVQARLETGRTHQVRLHFAEHGHPLIGDPVYGRAGRSPLLKALGAELARQALHAQVLAFEHPGTGQRLHFACPLPLDMRSVVQRLRGQAT